MPRTGDNWEEPPTDQHPVGIDAYQPKEIASRVEKAGVAKANASALQLFTLALLAGAFIAFGAMFYTVTITGSELGFGPTRFLGAMAFSLGLILVIVGGAELFTGNNLIVIAWADGKISLGALMRNWIIVYIGNLVAAIATAAMMVGSGALEAGDGAVAKTAVGIAEGKLALGFMEAFLRGILCNALVCLAVWLCFAARSVTDKILAIIFPIAGFVAIGFEHSVANMYLIPVGMMTSGTYDIVGFLGNLIPVTLGNIVGGGVFVALIYYLVYIRPAKADGEP